MILSPHFFWYQLLQHDDSAEWLEILFLGSVVGAADLVPLFCQINLLIDEATNKKAI